MLGLPVDGVSLDEAATWILDEIRQPRVGAQTARLVVTLNPEIAILARSDDRLATALRRAELSVADGVGITWAARRKGLELPQRVPGVDLVTEVLKRGGSDLSVYLLGAKPGVAEAAARVVTERYGTRVVGVHHGYFDKDKGASAISAMVRASRADLLLAYQSVGVLGRPSAFEYVLVHELCHLIHADHSPAFWAEVEARRPDWRLERDWFRLHGRRLKAMLRVLAGPVA